MLFIIFTTLFVLLATVNNLLVIFKTKRKQNDLLVKVLKIILMLFELSSVGLYHQQWQLNSFAICFRKELY